MKPKYLNFLFAVLVLISLFLKIGPTLGNNFPFTMDQARDMLAIRRMAVGLTPALVGPTTSINGVFLGPFWYYFNLPAFIFSGGNPAALVYWQILWYHLAAIIFYIFTYKKNHLFVFIFSLLFIFVPTFFYATRYSWNANAMPIFTLIYLVSLVETLTSPSRNKLFLLGLIAGLSFQIEAAFAVLFFPFAFFSLLINNFSSHGGRRNSRMVKLLAWLTLGFVITLIPQVLFELRHDFISTKTLLGEFTGQSDILGQKLTFIDRLNNRVSNYQGLLSGTLRLPSIFPKIIFYLSVLTSAFLIFTKKITPKQKLYFLTSISFIILSFFFYLIYPNNLKGWFITGLTVFYLIPTAITTSFLITQKQKILLSLITIFLIFTIFREAAVEYDHLPKPGRDRSTDRSQLNNELAVIDWVYQEANGRPFKAYNYMPSVYDFPYQYLYWWHGAKTYGYHPDVVSYADGVPEYMTDNNYWDKSKKVDSEDYPIFLIIEHDLEDPQRQANWLANFSHLCFSKKQDFSWTSHAELYYPCK
jgi:hypothetical protein